MLKTRGIGQIRTWLERYRVIVMVEVVVVAAVVVCKLLCLFVF